jgi:cytochrome P450
MFKEAQNLPYLQAVIKEALRLHPASGLPLGRVVPKGGAEIAGYYFPEQVSFSFVGSYVRCSSNQFNLSRLLA